MSDLDFDRLRSLVVEALELPPKARAQFLREACDNPALLEAALQLLRHDATEGPSAAKSKLDPLKTGDAEDGTGNVDEWQIGRYPVTRRLGEGGMGVVYLARDLTLDREVAIKQLPTWLAEDPTWLEQFREEARNLARLNHPNIATIHSLETEGGRPFLTMEFIAGESLADVLRGGPLELDDALLIVRGVAGALEAAHARGIAHRDLKPDNVMITDPRDSKVLDFGLAQRVGTAAMHSSPRFLENRPSDSGVSSAGTPGYMSPERIRGEADDIAGDAWSFGCVLFECLAGVRAFGGAKEERLRATVEDDPPVDLLPLDLPVALGRLVNECLVKDPKERLNSLRSARRALESVIERRERDRLRSLQVREDPRSPLPRYLSRFLGREDELRYITTRLRDYRVVTLTGFGGCGKTRLAVEALSKSNRNAVWVDLAAGDGLDHVAVSILSALNVIEPGKKPTVQLAQILAEADTVLLLDNCEHVLSACRELIHTLMPQCPSLRFLATSREPIGVDGEVVISVSPLPVPPSDHVAMDNPSIQLFLDRASSLDQDEANGPLLAEICRRVEGIPLALEIAASQLDILTLTELRDRLDQRMELSRSQGSDRHRSLRAVIDWSFRRLEPFEQTMLCRMSVFASSWTLAAAEAVGLADPDRPWRAFELVKNLVRKSLVQRQPSTNPEAPSRFRMLETVSEYARERLQDSSDGQAASLALVRYFRTLFDRSSGDASEFRRLSRQFREEEENVSAAFDSIEQVPEEDHAELALDLSRFWRFFGRYRDWNRRSSDALARLDGAAPNLELLRCALRAEQVEVSLRDGKLDGSGAMAASALDWATELGDRRLQARILNLMGSIERVRGQLPKALECYDRAIAIITSDPDFGDDGMLRHNRGVALLHLGRTDEAEREIRRGLETQEGLKDELGVSHCINALGAVASIRGRYDEARQRYEQSLEIRRRFQHPSGVIMSLGNLARVAINQVRSPELDRDVVHRARAWCEEAIDLAKQSGEHSSLATLYLSLASVESLEGDVDGAIEMAERSLEVARVHENTIEEGTAFDMLARFSLDKKDYVRAQSYGEASFKLRVEASSVVAYQPLRSIARARYGVGDAAGSLALLVAAFSAAANTGARMAEVSEESDRVLRSELEAQLSESEVQEAVRIGTDTPLEKILGAYGDPR